MFVLTVDKNDGDTDYSVRFEMEGLAWTKLEPIEARDLAAVLTIAADKADERNDETAPQAES